MSYSPSAPSAEPAILTAPPATDRVADAIAALGADATTDAASSAAGSAQPVAVEAAPAETPPPVPPENKGPVSALIRQRLEVESRQRALAAEQARWRAEQGAVQERMRADLLASLREKFEADPAGFAESMGVKRSKEELARDLYFSEHSEAMTPEQRAINASKAEQRRFQRELEALKTEKVQAEQARAQAEQARMLADYRAQLQSGLSSLGDDTPLVKQFATARPGVVADQLIVLADRAARERPDLGVLGAQQLAQMLERALEAELEPLQPLFERRYRPTPATAPPPPQSSVPPAPTLKGSMAAQTAVNRAPITDDERIAAAVRAFSTPA